MLHIDKLKSNISFNIVMEEIKIKKYPFFVCKWEIFPKMARLQLLMPESLHKYFFYYFEYIFYFALHGYIYFKYNK